ncbi:MAG TPA: type II and III secretion system protein [Burkholderiales bacterium]|nr:type II and III secretion system protein [Burkholderiales bacterium]
MRSVIASAFVALATACAQPPLEPAPTHIAAEAPPPAGEIPPPVQIAPVLPPPQPTVKPETYSVVVSRVPAQELLFALARDAKLQIDIDPSLTGLVTLNAIDQTLPQLLERIGRQVDMRYEIDGEVLVIRRDTPFLRSYKIDYLSANRSVSMRSTASTQFGGTTNVAGSANTTGATGATSTIEVTAENHLWDSIVQNVRDLLRETDRVLPAGAAVPAIPVPQPPAAAPQGGAPAAPAPTAAPSVASGPTFQEAASVIGNRESGVLFVRATSKQHERVQEFLDQVMAGAKRQVLIEATVAEVQLRNEYQRGIEWQRLGSSLNGLEFQQPVITPPSGFNTSPFVIGLANTRNNFSATLRLLEQFGDVRVLSSPKLSVLNNQTAILRVTRDIIYFTITPSTQPITIAGGLGGTTVQASFTTTPNVAAEGFMMTVLPQINDADSIVLNVKPTIRRQVDFARDPNPALAGQATQNDIPLFETREFDSVLRLQSGDVAVLAGLMQDQVDNVDAGIPGVRTIPVIGDVLSSRTDLTRKTELVIFLRATVIRDPSLEGDFRDFRQHLPTADFFSKPNPQKVAPPVGPGVR